jgi:NTP pyrophosphatase (non-canonical NTP hydrolase)
MNHGELVKALCKPGLSIQKELKPSDCNIIHMCMGISGEAGELVDAIKKTVMYRKPLDMEHVIEELGDIEFYLEGLRQQLGITREETIEHNMSKLGARYSSGAYSDKQAVTRADKA